MKVFIILVLIHLYLGSIGAQIDNDELDEILDDVLPTVNQPELIQELKDMFPLPTGTVTILSVKTKDKTNTRCTHFTNIAAEKVVITINVAFQALCKVACQASVADMLENSVKDDPEVKLIIKELTRKILVLKIKFRCIIEPTTIATTTTTAAAPICPRRTDPSCPDCCDATTTYSSSSTCGQFCYYSPTSPPTPNIGTCSSASTFCPGGTIKVANDTYFGDAPGSNTPSPVSCGVFFFFIIGLPGYHLPSGVYGCPPGYCCVRISTPAGYNTNACLACTGSG